MSESFKPPAHLSPSSIESFVVCPLKWKYQRIDKKWDPPTEATTMGNFVHSVLEDLFRQTPDQRTVQRARELMAFHWNNEYAKKTEALVTDDEELRQFRWRSWWCVENYFKVEDPTGIAPGGIEYSLDGKIDEVRIKGFIDRWHRSDGGIVISDYKTGKTPSPKYQDNKFFQLYVYADLLGKVTGEPVKTVSLLYLKDGVALTENVTDDHIEAMRAKVTDVSVGIKKRCADGYFEPTPNVLCDWCSFKSICPAWAK